MAQGEKFYKQSDEDIDIIIRNETLSQKRNGGSKKTWDEKVVKLRHSVILGLIRRGYSRAQVVEELSDRWDISDNSIINYYNDALEYLGELSLGEDIGKVKKKQIERLEAQMKACIDRGNYTNAARYNDMLNKINGLYTENQNINIDGEIKFDFE